MAWYGWAPAKRGWRGQARGQKIALLEFLINAKFVAFGRFLQPQAAANYPKTASRNRPRAGLQLACYGKNPVFYLWRA